MIILDTDTLSIAQHPDSPEALTLQTRVLMLSLDVGVASTIITYEEQTRGWLKFLAQARTRTEQIKAYHRLFKHLEDWRNINVLPFDENAADEFDRLRALKLRIGTYDLKIAAIALARDATVLTRNLRHFKVIPNLRVEDWTRP